MLGVSAGLGAPLLGVALLLAFALGRIIPVGIGAFAVGWLENLRGVAAYRLGFEVMGGLILIAAGLYMLNAVFSGFLAWRREPRYVCPLSAGCVMWLYPKARSAAADGLK